MSAMPTPLYTAEQIRARVAELARSLAERFPVGETPHLVAVLNGSFMFLADLVRAMTRPVTIDFVRITSYGSATTTSGTPRLVHGPTTDLRDRHVVIVEDIVDTGLTLQTLRGHLLAARPRSLNTVVLLDKPARRRTTVPVDLVGFSIPDQFVVGYGLDSDGAHRQLPYLGVIAPS
ncbi:MAG: hypoxanthine phosphoribosyltransferase [Acidobacteria bacterium]|nr:hypoxanthine phosphoribosyltransferase [Acidobacteriota bacterium]